MHREILCFEKKMLSKDELLKEIISSKKDAPDGHYVGRIAYIINNTTFAIKTHDNKYYAVVLHDGEIREVGDDYTSTFFLRENGIDYIFKSNKVVEVQVGCNMDLEVDDKTYEDQAKLFVSLRGVSKHTERFLF